jgi:AAHS family 4-hydroxybenzoate transporter-like MFS transporter
MIGPRRIFALVMLALVFVMEGYDIAAMSLAVPRLGPELGLAPTSFGLVFTALLVGIGIGGAVVAPLGDRIGRRPLIVFGCLAVAIATLATASANSIPEFLVWRLLTGIGFGACLPNVSALSAELAPERMRATIMAVVSAGIPLGLALAGIFAPEVIAVAGWHGLFMVPGLTAAMLALTLGYLLASGVPDATRTAPASAKVPQIELFRTPWLFPFAVFALILSLNALNLYLLNSWLPIVLPMAEFSLDEAARVSGIVQFAGIGIGVIASLFVDRWRPAPTLMVMFGAMAVCFAAVALSAPDAMRWTLLLAVGVGGASAGAMVLPTLCVYLFSPRLLSSAIGMGILVARIAAFCGPLVGQAILDAKGGPHAFFLAAAVPAALCVLACLLLPAALKVRARVEQPAA